MRLNESCVKRPAELAENTRYGDLNVPPSVSPLSARTAVRRATVSIVETHPSCFFLSLEIEASTRFARNGSRKHVPLGREEMRVFKTCVQKTDICVWFTSSKKIIFTNRWTAWGLRNVISVSPVSQSSHFTVKSEQCVEGAVKICLAICFTNW